MRYSRIVGKICDCGLCFVYIMIKHVFFVFIHWLIVCLQIVMMVFNYNVFIAVNLGSVCVAVLKDIHFYNGKKSIKYYNKLIIA